MRVRLVLIDGTKKKCVQAKIAEDELVAIERLPVKVLHLGTSLIGSIYQSVLG